MDPLLFVKTCQGDGPRYIKPAAPVTSNNLNLQIFLNKFYLSLRDWDGLSALSIFNIKFEAIMRLDAGWIFPLHSIYNNLKIDIIYLQIYFSKDKHT